MLIYEKKIEESFYTAPSRSTLDLLIKAISEVDHVVKDLNC